MLKQTKWLEQLGATEMLEEATGQSKKDCPD